MTSKQKVFSIICLLKENERKNTPKKDFIPVQVQIHYINEIKIGRQNKLSDCGAMLFTSDFSVSNKRKFLGMTLFRTGNKMAASFAHKISQVFGSRYF